MQGNHFVQFNDTWAEVTINNYGIELACGIGPDFGYVTLTKNQFEEYVKKVNAAWDELNTSDEWLLLRAK